MAELVTLSQRREPEAARHEKARRQFVERLLALSKPPPTVEREKEDDLELFRDRVMPHVESIMRVVVGAQALRRRELDWRTRAAIDALGATSDLFELLGLERDEVTYTRAIAAFLNAREPCRYPGLSSDCGGRFESLLRRKNPNLGDLALNRAYSEAERTLGREGRVDIALESDAAVVFIEAKIGAEERANQLDDYSRELTPSRLGGRQGVLVFLTARKDQVSQSAVPHIHICFEELLLAWLPLVLGEQRHGDLRHYLKAIAVHLAGVAARGPFELWPISTQRACLELLEKEGLDP
ncbi:MAG TPA: PD-(D/E)XK nuclease family protein [Polyangiaceae bacterium]|nr:PD-(D/E)XK nuclease family protein [Polyangiaceae bacterium]